VREKGVGIVDKDAEKKGKKDSDGERLRVR